MHEKNDAVEDALQSLRCQHWPGDNHNTQLEEKLMRDFESKRSVFSIGRHPVLALALAIVVLGSLGFAATGGVGLIRSLFVTTEVNGEVIDAREVVTDESGNASFTIPMPDCEGEAEVALTVEGPADGEEGVRKTINVTMTGGENGAQVDIQTEDDE